MRRNTAPDILNYTTANCPAKICAEQPEPPPLHRDALVWGHCHHRATGGMTAEHQLLKRMGMTVQPLHGGCCGLAGSITVEKSLMKFI